MKLLSLKINARGEGGWESPLFTFGDRTTSLFGPNGSGKTPVVQSIPFCLGFDVKFQNDVREKCHSATLTITHGAYEYIFTRAFGDFHVVVQSGAKRKEFFNEADFSKDVFESFNLSVPSLVGINRQATKPYLSTLLPIFYVRQIGGYDEPYRPPSQFIQDQFVEMVRFAFDLGPKRSYTAQRDLLAARDQLDGIQRKVVFQQKVIVDLAARIDDSPLAWESLTRRADYLDGQIKDLRESADASGAADDALAELLLQKEERIRGLRRQHADLSARVSGIFTIRSEIEGEIQTLSLNEESRRAFESFFDVCRRPDCGLFVSSSASYAKNLMYLKDQIKDLEANVGRARAQLGLLGERLQDEEAERVSISKKMAQKGDAAGTRQLVAATQTLTRELMLTEQAVASIEQLRQERNKFLQFEVERSTVQDRIANLTNNGRQDHAFNSLRVKIQGLTVKWMEIIGTPNASRQAEIDLEFKFRFGKQAIDVFNGSTRSRLILAIHAALFELYLEIPERPFRFLILDTPKQQELASTDLAKYLHALEAVCDRLGGQIMVSSTEYHHSVGMTDREWLPSYQGEKQLMYLGRAEDRSS
ncbi:MAG: hypothetical protein V4679_16740 [Pseudomonadota bacterium]